MQPRPATPDDLPATQSIYAHHVLHGTGTFDEVPPSVEEVTATWRHVTGQGWPWLVVDDASGVLGFGYYAQLRDRSAYRFTAENSVYVREDVRGQGVGRAILAALIDHATAAGFRQMVAVIGDSENAGSLGVHASLGFTRVGTMRAVGFKFGRWLNVVTMQRSLAEPDGGSKSETGGGEAVLGQHGP